MSKINHSFVEQKQPSDYRPRHPAWLENSESLLSKYKAKRADKKAKRVNKKAILIKDSKAISKALHDANAIIDESVKDAVNAGISHKELKKNVMKNLKEHEKKELMKAYKILKVPT
jgi:hypothetical protein|tara:strand:- start:78 stop:425 length:348 start_codon:yes stop_codon:yes gene_type:complete